MKSASTSQPEKQAKLISQCVPLFKSKSLKTYANIKEMFANKGKLIFPKNIQICIVGFTGLVSSITHPKL